jgi:UPF0755 protein
MEESASRIHSHRPWLLAAVAPALLVVTAAAVAAAGYYVNQAPGMAATSRTFTIQSGETLTGVAQRLHGAGFIRSPVLLRVLARGRGAETGIRAGFYRFPAGATSNQILDLLMAGSNDLVRVTIPEGWTSNRIAAHLEERDITDAVEFRTVVSSPELMRSYGIEALTAEGYLFPDTYYFPRGYGAEAVARHMVDTFFGRLVEIHPGARPDAPELHDKVILASIVEREYRLPREAPLIASVFNNRLQSNARLESCATIVYIITEIQGHEHPERIYEADLEIESAFNTYRSRGLPPAPIANPGLTALRAALYPADTDYRYFVVKDPDTGAHHFSSVLSEHSEAKFVYLKGVAQSPRRAHS